MRKLMWTGATVVLGSVLLMYVWGKMEKVKVGYSLEQLHEKKADLKREHDRLRLRLSQLTSPDRIAREAVVQLGLRAPQPGQIHVMPVAGYQEEGNSDIRDTDSQIQKLQLAKTVRIHP